MQIATLQALPFEALSYIYGPAEPKDKYMLLELEPTQAIIVAYTDCLLAVYRMQVDELGMASKELLLVPANEARYLHASRYDKLSLVHREHYYLCDERINLKLKLEKPDEQFKIPNWRSLIPKTTNAINGIALNVVQLESILDVLGELTKNEIIQQQEVCLYFSGTAQAVTVTYPDVPNFLACIMPLNENLKNRYTDLKFLLSKLNQQHLTTTQKVGITM